MLASEILSMLISSNLKSFCEGKLDRRERAGQGELQFTYYRYI